MQAPLGCVMSQKRSPLTEQFAAEEHPSPMRGEHATASALNAMARRTMALMAARTVASFSPGAMPHTLSLQAFREADTMCACSDGWL